MQQYYNIAEQLATVSTVAKARVLVETYYDCLDLVERYLPNKFKYLIDQIEVDVC
jgi:hypothetical protein